MTVQYNGGDSYTIFTEYDTFILPKSTIDEIQSYDFERSEPTDSVEKLRDKIEDLEGELYEALGEIRQLQDELDDR